MASFSKLQDQLAEVLEPGENVVACVYGAYETKVMGSQGVRNGIFAATEKRIVFYGKKLGGYDLESFPFEQISSVEDSKGLIVGNTISFFAAGNRVSLKWIKKGDIPEFLEYAKSQVGRPAQSAPMAAAAPDIPEQIKKLSDLHDQGILTDEEFDQKKSDLLSKM